MIMLTTTVSLLFYDFFAVISKIGFGVAFACLKCSQNSVIARVKSKSPMFVICIKFTKIMVPVIGLSFVENEINEMPQ